MCDSEYKKLSRNQIERRCALRDVLAPLDFLGEALQHVQRLVVVLTVPLVERRLSVLGQSVVEPFLPLLHVGTASIFPALDEEHFHVVVGEGVARRDDSLVRVPPHEPFEEAAELPSVQNISGLNFHCYKFQKFQIEKTLSTPKSLK